MRDEIIKYLSRLTDEEQQTLSGGSGSKKEMYSKSGRFIIERRTVSNISTGEASSPICLRAHPRFCDFPEHTHDYVELMYVCQGTLSHKIGNATVAVSAGSLIALGKNTKHSILAAGEKDIGINIIISSELFEGILNAVRRDSSLHTRALEVFLDSDIECYRVFDCACSVEISNIMESIIYSSVVCGRTDDYMLEQSVKMLMCYLCSLFGDYSGEATYNEQAKKKVLKYIRASYATATLSELADILGLSPTYLSRWIRSSFGEGFKELLMRERFSIACDLLRTTDTPIGEIIIHVGYENSSYFHKEFKKRYGITPKEYRKNT